MKRVLLVAAAAALGAAAFAGNAAAKGPSEATISGPGLASSIVLRGDAESSTSTNFSIIVQESGFFATVFGGQSPDPRLKTAPKGNLGPRYSVVYAVPGPNGTASKLRAELYPYVKPWPIAHMAAGQRFWGRQSTKGGWVRGNARLRSALIAVGLPAKAPDSSSRLSVGAWAGIASAGALALLALGSAVSLRRPRRGNA
jgi:hypothetical protein